MDLGVLQLKRCTKVTMNKRLKHYFLKYIAILLLMLGGGAAVAGPPGCVGKMWNPLADIDFRLMGGIKIAGIRLMKAPEHLGEPPNHKVSMICACKDGLKSGIGLGMLYWLPSYIADVSRQAGCIGFLNGLNILPGFLSLSSGQEYNIHGERKEGITNMQIHWAYADITAIAGKQLFESCDAVTSALSIAYLTEPDFIFQNDVYSAIMTPQVAILASNAMLSQIACGVEAVANTLGDWQDFGVCGWQGTRLPLTANTIGKNSAQVSNMDIALKYLTRSALLGSLMRTMGKDVACRPKYSPFYDPFQHRYQWAYPGKVSTRYNVDVLRWGMFIRDNGQGSLASLHNEAKALAQLDATLPRSDFPAPTDPGSGKPANSSALNLAQQIMKRIPKPLNYPTREAGYMQVWEARTCCLMVLTIENVIKKVAENLASQGGELVQSLYEVYSMGSTIYEFVSDPIGAGLGMIGGEIADALGDGLDSLGGAVSGIVDSI